MATDEQKIAEQEKEDLVPALNSSEDLVIYQEMMGKGLMYGHKKSRTNPKFKPYIHTTRNGIEIIDLTRTLQTLEVAIEFLKQKIKDNGLILVVATQPAAKEAVENLTKKFNFSHINERWIGGLLTNFKVISARIEHFKKVQADFEKGAFEKYTKKERVMINKNIHRMRKMFVGLENLVRLPDALFIIDTSVKSHDTALKEAKRLGIPVVALIDSDDNPELVQYPIPANDHAKMSIEWIINKLSNSLESDKPLESISN